MKIRINDLARELEVKAKVILDILPEVGVTEKKTHSSSIEEDEAVRVRKHFSARYGSSSRERTSATEVKPKIDLSKISKPGDVARLLREREQQQHHPPAPPAKAPPLRPASCSSMPVKTAPAGGSSAIGRKASRCNPKPAAPAAERSAVVTPPVVKPAAPTLRRLPVEKPAAPPAVVVTPPAHPPAVVVTPPPAAAQKPACNASSGGKPAETPATPPSTRPVPGQPIGQQRRMITPQTGPRPVYTAPPPRALAPSAPQGRSMQGSPGTRPMQSQGGPGQRPQGVVRGQPIFQRPRPGGPSGPGGPPGSRPPYQGRPGEQRRGPHPTSRPVRGAIRHAPEWEA